MEVEMRFDRRPRSESYNWTARKESAYLQRHKREAKRIERDIPLFADQYAPQPVNDVAEEKARRERMAAEGDQSMRDLQALQWRRARVQYFACSVEVRAIVTDAWRRWRGPAQPGYFVYVLEQHNGVAEQKARQRDAERAALHARIERDLSAQAALLSL
jgi:hypothetical protein